MPRLPCHIHDTFGKFVLADDGPTIKITVKNAEHNALWAARVALLLIAGSALIVLTLQIG